MDTCATPGCTRQPWCGLLPYCAECLVEHHPEFLQEAAKIPILGPPVHMSELNDEDTDTLDTINPGDVIEAIHEDDDQPN
jgi:hypothetical protein